jgi:nucleotide-binding universal stress UspA family protein
VKTIVVGYDGTRAAERALSRAADLARAFASRVIVVSVAAADPITELPVGAFGLAPYGYPPPSVTEQPTEDPWEEHRGRVVAFLTQEGVAHAFAPSVGRPAEEIVQIADEHDADLIVVGTREPGFVQRLVGASVSHGVARRAHCDVLIVHPKPDDAL